LSEQFLYVDPELIDPLENIRVTVDREKYDGLKEDIRHRGIQETVRLRPHPDGSGRYQVYAGRLRCRVALEAKVENRGIDAPNGERRTWAEAPILVPALLKNVDDIEAYAFTYSENANRIDVDDYTSGSWLRIMKLKFGPIKLVDLGKRVGRSVAYVSKMISFADAIDSDGLLPPTERAFRVFRKLRFEQQATIKDAVSAGGAYPSVRAMERMMKAKGTAEEVLKTYDPYTTDDEFLKYVLQEEAGLTILEAKLEILRWRKGAKIEIQDDSPDQRYIKLTRFYPVEMIQIISDDSDQSKPLDWLAMRGRMLTRALWNKFPEEMKREVIDKWKLKDK